MSVQDIEYVLMRHPDTAAAADFMRDFGLLDLESREGRVYMRTYGDSPLSWVTEPGEAAFVGMGFRLADAASLTSFAERFRAAIVPCPHPGGRQYGRRAGSGRAAAGIRLRCGARDADRRRWRADRVE